MTVVSTVDFSLGLRPLWRSNHPLPKLPEEDRFIDFSFLQSLKLAGIVTAWSNFCALPKKVMMHSGVIKV